MTIRKHSPLHDKWHKRVEGQIRDAMTSHPEWFNIRDSQHKAFIINSLAKRIVGEIVADFPLATKPAGVGGNCSSGDGVDGDGLLPSTVRGVAENCPLNTAEQLREVRGDVLEIRNTTPIVMQRKRLDSALATLDAIIKQMEK